MKYLIVGLGNIGKEYEETRHNIGFKILDELASSSGIFFTPNKLASSATIKYKGRQIILLKPSTYMNLSGKAVNYWMQTEKVPIERVFILTDEKIEVNNYKTFDVKYSGLNSGSFLRSGSDAFTSGKKAASNLSSGFHK